MYYCRFNDYSIFAIDNPQKTSNYEKDSTTFGNPFPLIFGLCANKQATGYVNCYGFNC